MSLLTRSALAFLGIVITIFMGVLTNGFSSIYTIPIILSLMNIFLMVVFELIIKTENYTFISGYFEKYDKKIVKKFIRAIENNYIISILIAIILSDFCILYPVNEIVLPLICIALVIYMFIATIFSSSKYQKILKKDLNDIEEIKSSVSRNTFFIISFIFIIIDVLIMILITNYNTNNENYNSELSVGLLISNFVTVTAIVLTDAVRLSENNLSKINVQKRCKIMLFIFICINIIIKLGMICNGFI